MTTVFWRTMPVHVRIWNLVVLPLVWAVASPCAAFQTGPRTLENLLQPSAEERQSHEPGPLDRLATQQPDGPRAAGQPAAAAKRLAVPEQAAVDEAMELIHQAFEETIQSAATNLDAAIRTFLETADKTADPARKFALLLLAERLALEARATSTAVDVLARRAALFEIDALAARLALLARVARADDARPEPPLFEHVAETARLACTAERFDLADAAVDLAETIARAIEKDEKIRLAESRRKREPPPATVAPRLLAEATSLRKAARDRRRQAFEYATARDTLAAYPNDAEAAETVGRYLCFVKRDWPAGLAALARGRDPGLRDTAARELALAKDPRVAATVRLGLANDWWRLAEADESLPADQVAALKAHASGIYRDIAGRLTDPIDAALARKRAGGAEPAAAERRPAQKPGLPTLDSKLLEDRR